MEEGETPNKINGQYIGGYTNTTRGFNSFLCVNIDHTEGTNHEAHITVYSGDTIYTAQFTFDWVKTSVIIHIDRIVEYAQQKDGTFIKSEATRQKNKSADLTLGWDKCLRLSWKTDSGQNNQTHTLIKSSDKSSTLVTTITTWHEFKRSLDSLELDRYFFRGQPEPKRLRTSFHRTDRSNLSRYYKKNLPELQHFISSLNENYFNISEKGNLISLLSLVQHHGYPTPILDWTMSPYIAAYFAFQQYMDKSEHAPQVASDKYIRIYQLDFEEYQKDIPQFEEINDLFLHVSFSVTPLLSNQRAMPQQSVSCISTIDDIEAHIEHLEKQRNKTYLTAYDIPFADKSRALKDLELMGITHASLFPGMDGLCTHLRRKHFQQQT